MAAANEFLQGHLAPLDGDKKIADVAILRFYIPLPLPAGGKPLGAEDVQRADALDGKVPKAC